MANAKVIVTTRFVVDSKIIYTGSKLHDDSATVKLVIDTALEKAEQRAGSSLTCGSSGAGAGLYRPQTGRDHKLYGIPHAAAGSVIAYHTVR